MSEMILSLRNFECEVGLEMWKIFYMQMQKWSDKSESRTKLVLVRSSGVRDLEKDLGQKRGSRTGTPTSH